ncbi:Carbohydrate-binding and sugar hydrolysis [Hydrogenobacter thermophilus TK-6]|uniref:NosD protein n=1 Tax=Hydrogenobacter thermophilus (strain DSM 6534 / IAM 12695 / TK-6) TaxID=608538 RepID=D3DFM5_HYDTT|nr:nitrous oxide reductase family maturation protein NosD [Hydrogenobacter thermophilus]ADO44571.1 Carbohydrate-binding and sugar hydrolysis [Hydrogenobacter thermophilus TK-6]BAI68627.1 nosD protein [Hydrogenobacter thermophilus TK-6]
MFSFMLSLLLVCSTCEFKDIQSALKKAREGDRIVVKSGTYKGGIVIDKKVELVGEGKPVVDGEGKLQVITVKADSVKIEGFIIKNSGMSYSEDIAGLKVINSRDCVIKNNKFLNNFFAIYLERVQGCLIEGNSIVGFARSEGSSGNGIHAWNSEKVIIRNNYVKGHRDGIYFEFVKDSLIENNRSEYNLRYGLHFMFSNDDTYRKNYFYKNGAGVAVMYSKNIRMEENTFAKNEGQANYGLLLKDIYDSVLYGNRFINNTHGVYLEGCNRTEFKGNLFENNGWAVRIYANSEDNLFIKNSFLGNAFDVSTNTLSYFRNTFESNYYDQYEGYDINRDGYGDIPYRPVSFVAVLFERYPLSLLLYGSFFAHIMDAVERYIPLLNPQSLLDSKPLVRRP